MLLLCDCNLDFLSRHIRINIKNLSQIRLNKKTMENKNVLLAAQTYSRQEEESMNILETKECFPTFCGFEFQGQTVCHKKKLNGCLIYWRILEPRSSPFFIIWDESIPILPWFKQNKKQTFFHLFFLLPPLLARRDTEFVPNPSLAPFSPLMFTPLLLILHST